MSNSIDDIPIVDTNPKRLVSMITLQRRLSENVMSAIHVLEMVMMKDKARDADKIAAAGKVIDYYLKVEKQRQDGTLAEQQKRLNALKINKEVLDANIANGGYKSPNSLSYDVSEDNLRLERDSLMS
jgi:hypothetical protein